nr:protein farnesyltransferase subunit beta [Leptinotarsa decemlineata]
MESILKLRPISEINESAFNTENCPTKSSDEQIDVERLVLKKYGDLQARLKINSSLPELLKDQHRSYLFDNISYLSSRYECLDASRPWLCYWILHPLSLMGITLDNRRKASIARFLSKCQNPDGGFGGGPGQFSHLAATYAAVNSLVILGTEEALNTINRKTLQDFLWRVRQPDGSFAMHVGGEVDIRGAYCALSVASLAGVMTPELFDRTAEWIVSCQTYEGGFSGCPGMEAHGGYAFCGLAALVILNKGHLIDEQALLRWLVNRQMKLEGGFQGRTNKLVDGCYSFWQGGAFPLLYSLLDKAGNMPSDHLFNECALQEYLLVCCQNPDGGLLDKPGKPSDIYHTCYTLSGLSVAQHFKGIRVLSSRKNTVMTTHSLYNIRTDMVRKALLHFNNLGLPAEKNST